MSFRTLIPILGFIAIIMVSLGATTFSFPYEKIIAIGEGNKILIAFLLGGIMFLSTVIAPITTLPIVFFVAPVIGPFTAAVACITGWTLGAIVAFLIARYGGRPLIGRFVDMDSIARIEARIPTDTHFILLVMLRIAIPVDVLSYALGLFSNVSLREYTLTTLIGVSWFGFVFSYLGEAFTGKDYVLLGILGVASMLIFLTAMRYIKKHSRTDKV